MTRRIAIVMGTRPEAIKLVPVIRRMAGERGLEPVIVSTGQHREMLSQVVERFGIEVNEDLRVMRPGQTLAELTARLMSAVDAALARTEPDWVVVQGDTTTALVGALAGFYRRVPVAHVEAGLRTGCLQAPFPEEANRVLIARLAALHFAATEQARQNLLGEGVDRERVQVTGNTVIDALHMEVDSQQDPAVRARLDAPLNRALGPGWRDRPFVLVTGHRRENCGPGLARICKGLAALAKRFPDHRLIYPVHLNPRVRGPVRERLAGLGNVFLIEPQPYDAFVALMAACRLVLTDSGGVQEEAPALGKPVLVLRDATERPEGVAAGTVRLVGADPQRIVKQVSTLLTDSAAYDAMAGAVNPYGDGRAAGRIVERLAQGVEATTREQFPGGETPA